MVSKEFYSIEYFIDGEWELKQVFLSDEELRSLKKMFEIMGVSHNVNLLSRVALGVSSIDDKETSAVEPDFSRCDGGSQKTQ